MEFWGFKMLILLKFYLFISRLLHFLFYVSSSHSNSENHLDCNFQNFYESMTNMMRICKIVIHVKIWGFRYVLTYSQTGINSSNWVQQFTQPAKLVPRTSRGRSPPTSPGRPLKILFDHPGDVPNWHPRGVSKWRPGDVLIWRPRDVSGRLIQDVSRTFSGRPLDDLENT